MSDNLNSDQFGGFSEPDMDKYADYVRLHGKYVLHAAGNTIMHAYPAATDPSSGRLIYPTHSKKKPVASLTWFGGKPTEEEIQNGRTNVEPGTIYKAIVKPAHQRRGIASAMLDFAREKNPESHIRHSRALSPEGAAWAKAKP